jgi:hypothetical protein
MCKINCLLSPKLAALLLACAGNVWAACASNAVVFSCTTGKDKRIEVCEVKDHFEYSYGRSQAAAEIKVRVAKAKVSRLSWRGPDQWRFYSMDIPNGSTVYNVYWATDSEKSDAAKEGGVNVVTSDTVTATVACNPKRIAHSMSFSDRFVASGK